jgi:large repetitive protein
VSVAAAASPAHASLAAGAPAADVVAPQTQVVRGPGGTTWTPRARFRFASSEVRSRFLCSLDGYAWQRCGSPRTYAGLEQGWHTFRVRAVDAAGNMDATPATRSWRILFRIG